MAFTNRRTVLHLGAATLASGIWTQARACEFFAANLRILHPWVRASSPDQTSAVLSLTFDQVTLADRLVGLSTPVAQGAELVGADASPRLDLAIPVDRTTVLGEGGPHLRLTGLTRPLQVGRSYPMQLLFERGGPIAAAISVYFERLF